MLGCTVSVAGAVPLVGETLSQGAFEVAVKDRVPTPWLDTATDCEFGLEPPAVAEKERLLGLNPSTGDVGTDQARTLPLADAVAPFHTAANTIPCATTGAA
jgi:hypothetical protein